MSIVGVVGMVGVVSLVGEMGEVTVSSSVTVPGYRRYAQVGHWDRLLL